jgi:peptide/nickel transport system permease protein
VGAGEVSGSFSDVGAVSGAHIVTPPRASRLLEHPLFAVLARRLIFSVPLVFIVSVLVFVLTALTPGDVTQALLGFNQPTSAYVSLRHQLGLDKPLYQQYWDWLSHAVHGDFGASLLTKTAVSDVIVQHLPVTLCLVFGALIVSAVVGVGLGILSAVRGGAVGRAVDAFSVFGWVIPVYWLAAMMVVVFAVKLRWFPATGYVSFSQSPLEWLRSLVLPVLALSVGAIAGFAKYTREAMLDALSSEYIRMARANGVPGWSIVFQHAFKSASVQVVTLMGLLTVGLLAGTVFVENVFALPGLGSQIVLSVTQSDLPVVQGIAVFFTLIVVAVNLLVDLAYTVISPKVRVND